MVPERTSPVFTFLRSRPVVETAGAGVVGGCVGAATVLGLNGVADAGDWLGFLGTIVGTIVAIGGAVAIEDWKRRAEVKRRKDDLVTALEISVRRLRDLVRGPHSSDMMMKDKARLAGEQMIALERFIYNVESHVTNFALLPSIISTRRSIAGLAESFSNAEKAYAQTDDTTGHDLFDELCLATSAVVDFLIDDVQRETTL